MTSVELIPVGAPGGERVNVFIHGYRSVVSAADVETARVRVARAGVAGENYLLRWASGRWLDAAAFAGARTVYRVSRGVRLLSPWTLAAEAALVGAHEATQFKLMERRADLVGAEALPELLAGISAGRPVNLIGHSLGARVVHRCLGADAAEGLPLHDAVLLAGAADLDAPDWPACVARLGGMLYNAYSRRDPVLWITPDLKRRVGSRPLRQVLIEGKPRVLNVHAAGVGHTRHWTHLADVLPRCWPGVRGDA